MYGPPLDCKMSFLPTRTVCSNVSGLSRASCGCSQAMMKSARTVPNKLGTGSGPAFGRQAYGAPINCCVINSDFSQTQEDLLSSIVGQAKRGSRRSYVAPGVVKFTQAILANLLAKAMTCPAFFGPLVT
jgi:hypothetical protein